MRRKQRGQGWAATVVVLLGASLAGCGDAAPKVEIADGPYRAEFEAAIESAESDFQRAALADGVITDAEVREAYDRVISCAADQGLKVTHDDAKGIWNITYPVGTNNTDALRGEFDACERMFNGEVGFLYSAMRDNPDNEDLLTARVECLVARGVMDPGATPEEYLAAAEASTFRDDPAVTECDDPFGE